jgi:tubulin polyglutamylase TTLL4
MLSNYADKRRVEPEIFDMREIYLNEAHKVKNGYHHHHQQQQQHMGNNGYPLNHFYGKQQHHNNYDEFVKMTAMNGGNPRNLIFDTHRRRMRARSESEPHELYTTHHNLQQLNASRGHHDDFSLKRSREVASPPLAFKLRTATVFGKETTSTLSHGGATAKTINPHHSLLISSHQFNKMTTPRLRKSKSPAVVNGNNNNNRRSESPLLRKTSTLSRTNSNSSTNSFVRQSASPTLRKSQIQQQQRQLMLKKRNSEERSSDQSQDECDTSENDEDSEDLDDSDDFIGDDDDSDDFDASITDSEDSYKNHVASNSTTTSASPKASIAPTVATESIPGGVVKPMHAAPLASSLFPNVPPYLTFASHFEKGPDM